MRDYLEVFESLGVNDENIVGMKGNAADGVTFTLGGTCQLPSIQVVCRHVPGVKQVESWELYKFAEDLLDTIVSQTTDHDACQYIVVFRAAHHEDEGFAFGDLVLDMKVTDWLT